MTPSQSCATQAEGSETPASQAADFWTLIANPRVYTTLEEGSWIPTESCRVHITWSRASVHCSESQSCMLPHCEFWDPAMSYATPAMRSGAPQWLACQWNLAGNPYHGSQDPEHINNNLNDEIEVNHIVRQPVRRLHLQSLQ